MKDYRAFRRYTKQEWETDKEWRGKRLQFLWDARNYYNDEYHSLELYKEKNDFYKINDDEVSIIAASYNCYSEGELERYEKIGIAELYKIFNDLKQIKKTDKKEFLKKCNSNLYCFIREHRMEEMQEYKYENGL